MENRKNKMYLYLLTLIFAFTICLTQTNADVYENYFGIEMTSQQYNNLLNLGFSENEIYYMDAETFEINKDSEATLVAQNQKYYKTIYTGLDGHAYSTEITQDEYDNQSLMDPRGTVTTEYKTMVTTIAKNGNYYRYKVTVGWNKLPSVRSYDIIGIGFSDNVYIASLVNFNYSWCVSDGSCTTSTLYYDKQKLSTGGSVAYKLPGSEARSITAVLYYDVAKNTTDTITRLDMYGDYAHATSNVSSSQYTNYTINRYGISFSGGASAYYDEIPCAQSTWGGTW